MKMSMSACCAIVDSPIVLKSLAPTPATVCFGFERCPGEVMIWNSSTGADHPGAARLFIDLLSCHLVLLSTDSNQSEVDVKILFFARLF